MQFSTLLLAFTATLASGTAVQTPTEDATLSKRTCYTGGEIYGAQRQEALNAADNFCSVIPGAFNPGQGFGRCYNMGANKRVNFQLALRGDVGARGIGKAECLDEINKEINGCDRGGSTQYGNWIYTADPNTGPC